MGFKDKMMDRIMGKMSKEEKEQMMDKMMKEFFADMTAEDKKKMMMEMMPQMMEGINMREMMPQMMMGMMSSGKGEGGIKDRMGRGKNKEGMMGMMPQMMHEMMGDMDSEEMMKTMHEMMPRMMENCLTPMSEEHRRNMFKFCRKMLGEMEEQFLPSAKKGKTNS